MVGNEFGATPTKLFWYFLTVFSKIFDEYPVIFIVE